MAAAQTEATLKVGARSYTASELLKRPEIESITVKYDSAYGGWEMHYQAIAEELKPQFEQEGWIRP
jgi:hypothetical protein